MFTAADTAFVGVVTDDVDSGGSCNLVDLSSSPTTADKEGHCTANTNIGMKRHSAEAVNDTFKKLRQDIPMNKNLSSILERLKEKEKEDVLLQKTREEHDRQVLQMLAAIQATLPTHPPSEAIAQPGELEGRRTGSQQRTTALTSYQQRLCHSSRQAEEGTAGSKEKRSTSRTRTGRTYSAKSPRKKLRRTPKSTNYANCQQGATSPVQHATGKRVLPAWGPIAPFDVVLAGDVVKYYIETMGVLHRGLDLLPRTIVKKVIAENSADNHKIVVETMDGSFLRPEERLSILARPPKGYKGNYVLNPKPSIYTMEDFEFSNRRNKEVAEMIKKGTRPEFKTGRNIAESFLDNLEKDVNQAVSHAFGEKKDSV
jgi:cell fate (sporulation/competence/biofilm development) regulator YmcA (YheA/YmcA/DUF963 family)